MIWDFVELNPFANISGSFRLMVSAEADAIRGLSAVPSGAQCVRGSATDLPYSDESIDAVVTDPPYYDNI
jgi:putative DNA methylase